MASTLSVWPCKEPNPRYQTERYQPLGHTHGLSRQVTIFTPVGLDSRRGQNTTAVLLHDRQLIMLTTTQVPGLEEDLTPGVMHGFGHLAPGIGVILGDHDWSILPVGAGPVYEGAFVDDEAGAILGPVGVVFYLCWARFEVVAAAVAGHGAHDDTVPEREPPAYDDGFQEAGHGGDDLC